MRQKNDIYIYFFKLLYHFVIHIASFPVRTVKQYIEMIFIPCLHFVHTRLWHYLINALKFTNYGNALLKRNNRFLMLITIYNFICADTNNQVITLLLCSF